MNRFKLFIENFIIYGLGSVISKLVPLIMLPIVTRIMTDSYYFGLNDISTVVVNFGSAIAIMGMYDAMYRMFFDKNDDEFRKEICSTALIFTIATSIIVFIVLLLFKEFFSILFFSSGEYGGLLCLTALSILIGSTNSIISAPTRMQNKKKTFIFFNTISPIISYSISIPLLLRGHFVIALPLASIVSALSIEISFYFFNKKWFSLKKFNKNHLVSLLKIGLPLMPNFLIYWIFNSADKLMIAKMLGNQFTGIYAVGGKIGQVSQLIYTAFAGGWQFFAFSTMNDEDQVELTSNIFEYLGIIAFIAGMGLCCFIEPLFNILFSGEYIQGNVVAPYLFMAPLTQMLYQVACNQFIVIKKTWPTLIILSSGALMNVIINIFGIKYIGIEGAALATLIGYTFSTFICVIVLHKMKLLNIKFRFILIVCLFIIFFVVWRFLTKNSIFLNITLMLIVCFFYIILYKRDIKKLIINLKKRK